MVVTTVSTKEVTAMSDRSLASAAEDVSVLAAQYATQMESARRLDPAVVKAMLDAGFARHFVPVRHGGREGTFEELTGAIAAVGEGCTSTAWCASLTAHVGRMAAHLPEEGCAELWADGPDPLIVASLTPLGTAEKVDGGWRLSGTWPFISAVDHCDWALLGAKAAVDGAPAPQMLAVRKSDLRTEDTWVNVGMAATGSNTVTVEDVFVPDARSMSRADLFAGKPAASTAVCHTVPMQATTTMFAAPALGAARGALKSWTGYAEGKIRAAASAPPALPGMPTFNRASYDVTLTRSAGEIDAAEALLRNASVLADLGPRITVEETMRSWRDCALATEMLVTVTNRLFRGVGTTGQTMSNPVQRFWRDVNSAAGHMALKFESASTAWSAQVIQA
jgi:two-component flavin-dependent monooxygenase/oxygenase LndZ5